MTSLSQLGRIAIVAALGLLAVRTTAQTYSFTTYAGTARSSGNTDGTGGAARFNFPWGVAVDREGNVFVADSGNHTIRKLSAGGVVTTVAGLAGVRGSADGAGTAARFASPYGVAVDSGGNVFVADGGNHTIRRVSTAGVVTTLAGSAGFFGNVDGTGPAARFFSPYGVAVDRGGNVYVADTSNNTIRKITTGGVVTTLAGGSSNSGNPDGTGRAARFNDPHGVAVDGSGNVYVADTLNSRIRKITPGGVVTTLAGAAGGSGGGYVDGPGAGALFSSPFGVAVDGGGNLYIADTSNHAIRQITAAGQVTTLGGLGETSGSADGTGTAARFSAPCGVAVDDRGKLFVGDGANHTIRQGLPAVEIAADPGRLINLSILTTITASDPTFTIGTVVGGAGTSGNKSLLVRGVGPSLTPLGVSGALADPRLEFFFSPSLSYGNDNWDGAPFLRNAFASVGAFAFTSDSSRDAAIHFPSLAAGNYSVQFSGVGGATGTMIAELYDATPAALYNAETPRLINVSVLKQIAAGTTLTAGFVIGGTTSKTVLVRAVGPTLGLPPFNLGDVMADPKLELYNNATGAKLDENNDWGTPIGASAATATTLSATFVSVGAFALAHPATKDAVLLATLTPGQYSARVSASDSGGGTAIVEIYEVP